MPKIDANVVLRYIGKYNLDFVDCLLAGYAQFDNEKIFTFDEKLDSLITGEKNF